jgi:hypothetical protein
MGVGHVAAASAVTAAKSKAVCGVIGASLGAALVVGDGTGGDGPPPRVEGPTDENTTVKMWLTRLIIIPRKPTQGSTKVE